MQTFIIMGSNSGQDFASKELDADAWEVDISTIGSTVYSVQHVSAEALAQSQLPSPS